METPFPLLARHSAWANAQIARTVDSLDEAAYRADHGAFFRSIHGTLNHMLVIDQMWLHRFAHEGQRPPGITSLDQEMEADRQALAAARRAADEAYIRLVDALTDAELAEDIGFEGMDGSLMTVRRDRMLLTLFTHSAHHRGQLHMLITRSGLPSLALDIVDYLFDAAADPPPSPR